MSFSKIEISGLTGSISIDPPLFDYKVNLDLPFEFTPIGSSTFARLDESTISIKRSCVCRFELTESEMISLNTLIKNERGDSLSIYLQEGSGLFIAGPDKGDSGTFSAKMDIIRHNGMGNEPFRYFINQCLIEFTAYPTYSLPTEVNEGSFQIGSISNLRFPQGFFDPDQSYKYDSQLTEGLEIKAVNSGSLNDSVVSSFTMECNQSKAAALINELVSTIRTNQTTITAQNYHSVFGADHGDNQVFNAFFLQNRISIQHKRFNEFSFPLKFLLEENFSVDEEYIYYYAGGVFTFDSGVHLWP